MLNDNRIGNQMPVVDSESYQFAVVDHLQDCDYIKLAKDASGEHHYIPLSWVKKVDDKVHIHLSSEEARRAWLTEPPSIPAPESEPESLSESDLWSVP